MRIKKLLYRMFNRELRDDGWMLTEGIGSLLFYLIMLGTVAGALYMIFTSSKVAQMEQALTTMSLQVQGLYSGSSSYAGLNNNIVVNSGLVPKNLVRGTQIVTPWGGGISVAAGNPDQGTFQIVVAEIAQSDCTRLATYQLDAWENVRVNGTLISPEQRVPDAANACTNNNAIIYTAR
jgi:hypothetical protein